MPIMRQPYKFSQLQWNIILRKLEPKLDSLPRGKNKPPSTAGMLSSVGSEEIVDGEESVAGKFPWQAAIVTDDVLGFCSGSLIGGLWVLTAGHCIGT